MVVLAIASASQAADTRGPLRIEGGAITLPAPGADGVTIVKGLPYAAPPVGPLRWRPPAAVIAWSGVRAADRFGPDCPQKPSPTSSPIERPRSEDCLYLNVWTAAKPGVKQPVFVWIHGGGSRVGSGAQPQFDGTALAKQGVVVVTINYRLGALGFLSTSALSAESGYGASGNYGFMDDIAALRWVKRNIALFGGDPGRVTIGGESSGSVSTGALMVSPLAAGLFHQVIGESGSVFRVAEPGSMGASGLAAEEARGDALALKLGARDLAALRDIPADAVLAAAEGKGKFFNLPVVDGHVLPASPWTMFARRRHNDVPLLVGWNATEGSMQLPLGPLPELLAKYYGPAAPDVAKLYPVTDTNALPVAIDAAGDIGIAYSTWKWALAQQRFGTKPVYVYEFDRAPPIPAGSYHGRFDAKLAGAFHGAEIPYVFDTLAAQPDWAITDDDRRIAQQMSHYWANFIKTGHPDGPGLPAWPAYAPVAQPKRLQIGLTTTAQADPDHAKFMALKAVHDRIDPAEPAAR